MMIKKELELYVHIPFCVKKCAYCDFLSGPAQKKEMDSYVDALVREIGLRGIEYRGYDVSTVFVGGGTPSILKGVDTARIFHAIRENFSVKRDAEVTIEVNPGTVTEEKAEIWKKCGITRLSIGLQSVRNDDLKLLGRIHTYEQFLRTWELVRKTGFQNVNIDLISAIPGQTAESWTETLRTVAELCPEHISAYSLIVEEGTPFYEQYGTCRSADRMEGGDRMRGKSMEYPPLPDEDTERMIYKATEQVLAEYGYHRYEVSNYALPGYECRHNIGYWERKEYLGLGLGASSLVCEKRFHNPTDMGRYLAKCGTPDSDEEVEFLSTEEQMEEFMFLGLRKTEGVSPEDFRKAFGKDIMDIYKVQIRKLEAQGLLENAGGRIRLTERGTDISNYVFGEFIF